MSDCALAAASSASAANSEARAHRPIGHRARGQIRRVDRRVRHRELASAQARARMPAVTAAGSPACSRRRGRRRRTDAQRAADRRRRSSSACSFSRRFAISSWNCSSVSATPLPEVDEHVGDRAVARALPVARIGHVLVGRRVVHVADDVQDRALRQQRRRIVGVVVAAHPVVVVADAVQRLDVDSPRSPRGTSARRARAGAARTR